MSYTNIFDIISVIDLSSFALTIEISLWDAQIGKMWGKNVVCL